jgi:NAD(P)-dependent dehydrogenase (short-subunit alcohol dehydrogenase family)
MTTNRIDVTAKTVLVTGATDGLGRALARKLAASGAAVLIHGRDQERIRQTEAEIRHAARSGQVRAYRADFSDLAEVRRLSAQILAREERLDVLVNNAGIGSTVPGAGERMRSADGYELRFAVNYLAGYLLTHELLELLKASTPSRIVNVSSAGQMPLDFDHLMLEHDYSGVRAYCQSKLAQILFTFQLAEQLKDTGVTVTCLHPATYMPTKIVASPTSTLEEGVAATLALVADPELEGVTGTYFNGIRESRADPQAYDPHARRRLAVISRALVGSHQADA